MHKKIKCFHWIEDSIEFKIKELNVLCILFSKTLSYFMFYAFCLLNCIKHSIEFKIKFFYDDFNFVSLQIGYETFVIEFE